MDQKKKKKSWVSLPTCLKILPKNMFDVSYNRFEEYIPTWGQVTKSRDGWMMKFPGYPISSWASKKTNLKSPCSHILICVNIYMYLYKPIKTLTHMHTYMHINTGICIHRYKNMRVQTCTHMYTYIYTDTYSCTYTYIYKHIMY